MDPRIREAIDLTTSGRAEDAVALLTRVLDADPRNLEAREVMGVAYARQERIDDAVACMRELVELEPNHKMGWVNLSRFLQAQGLLEDAEAAQHRARVLGWKEELARQRESGSATELARKKDSPGGGGSLGTIELEAPAFVQVPIEVRIATFKKAIEKDARNELARFTLGNLYLDAKRPAEAEVVLRELVALKPDYSAAYLPYGGALEALGRLDEARAVYERGAEVADRKGDMVPRNKMRGRLRKLDERAAEPAG